MKRHRQTFPGASVSFRQTPTEKDDAFRKTYKPEGDDRRVRDENSKPFNRDGGNRRDFRGDGQGKRNFSAGRRPVSGLGKSRADISRQTEKLFAKPKRQTKSPGYPGDFV